LARLHLKDDTGLPSGSLKDRAAAVAVAHARLRGIGHLACASTGNAAASLAVLAARAGMTCTIYVPKDAPKGKLAQLLVHGADVTRVDGSYDQAFDLSLERIAAEGWYSRNCAHNPLLVEGKKTAALEMAYVLTGGFDDPVGRLPDAVLVPVGDGCIVSSVAKAFVELKTMDLIAKVPRVIGVQAAGAAPLARAWAAAGGADLDGRGILAAVKSVKAKTLADSIGVGVPRNRVKAWKWVTVTGGGFVSVPDDAIVEAIGLLARLGGVFAEPSGAAGAAGVLAAREAGLIRDGESVAVMVTGHGLKDPEPALKKIRLPRPVKP
jgi:threonine synthase